jgi:hypothetical protein
LIKHSAARQYLENLGYTTIAFKTGFHWTEITDADIYLTQNNAPLEQMSLIGGITEFESLLMKTSAGLLVADGIVSLPEFIDAGLDYPNKEHRERVLFILDELAELPSSRTKLSLRIYFLPFCLRSRWQFLRITDMTGYRPDQLSKCLKNATKSSPMRLRLIIQIMNNSSKKGV